MELVLTLIGKRGPSGFGSSSTAEQVTAGIDATSLTAIVTGGGSGIGAETVRVLALRGAHVVIGARNAEAANQVKKKIVKENASARITVLKLDLSSLKSVENFVDEFNALGLPLNILMYMLLSSFLLRVFFVHSRFDLNPRGTKTGNTTNSWSISNTLTAVCV